MAITPLIWALVAIVTVLSLFPTARLIGQVVGDILASSLSSSSLATILSERSTWRAFWHSLETSFWSMWIALILGGCLAFFISLSNIRLKSLWVFLFMLPMMIPPQVMALSWLQMMGPNSALLKSIGMAPPLGSPQPLYSVWGIVLLLGIQHAPLVFLTLRTSLLSLPKELIEAARLSGANNWQVLSHILLPLCKNGLWAAAALAFISALGNFGIPAMLGVPVSYYVLPTLIYQKMANFGIGMINEVASLSLLIAVLAAAVVWLQHHYQKRLNLTGLPGRPLWIELGRWRLLIEVVLGLVILFILVLPLFALLTSSLVPALGVPLRLDNISLAGYTQLMMPQSIAWRAFSNSLFLAGCAAVLISLIALPLSYWFVRYPSRLTSWTHLVMDIPYALPGVVLAIACILLFAKPLPLIQYSLYGTLWIILFAYLSRFLSVGFKPMHSSMMQLDPALEEAAQLAGASLAQRVRHIVLPLLAPAAFAGMILVFLIAFNELTVSALLWSARNETIGVLIFNLEESGDVIMASAISMVVIVIVVALMLSLSLLGRHLPKGVIPWQS